MVVEFVRVRSNASAMVENVVRNKAIARQYHTWFHWEQKNANTFFGLFGEKFKADMIAKVKQSDETKLSIEAFLEIGNERNKLVHQNFATFPLEKTLDEIYQLYQRATLFIESLPQSFIDCDGGC